MIVFGYLGASLLFYEQRPSGYRGMVHPITLLKILLQGGGFQVKGTSNAFQFHIKVLVENCLRGASTEGEWWSKYSAIAEGILQDNPHWGRLLVLVVATKCLGDVTGLPDDCLISWLSAVLYQSNTIRCEIPDECLERVWSGDRYWWFILLHCVIILYLLF